MQHATTWATTPLLHWVTAESLQPRCPSLTLCDSKTWWDHSPAVVWLHSGVTSHTSIISVNLTPPYAKKWVILLCCDYKDFSLSYYCVSPFTNSFRALLKSEKWQLCTNSTMLLNIISSHCAWFTAAYGTHANTFRHQKGRPLVY